MRNPSASLTPRQLRWIDEYMVDFNGAAAAVRAGYSRKCARSIAYENTTKPDIQAVLHVRQAELGNELRITREGVAKGLVEAVDAARQQQNPMAMVYGLRELARMLGFHAPEAKLADVNPSTADPLFKYSHMQDQELIALISSRR